MLDHKDIAKGRQLLILIPLVDMIIPLATIYLTEGVNKFNTLVFTATIPLRIIIIILMWRGSKIARDCLALWAYLGLCVVILSGLLLFYSENYQNTHVIVIQLACLIYTLWVAKESENVRKLLFYTRREINN